MKGESAPTETAPLFEHTHPEDLRHFGLIPELIGRFPVVTALHALDEAALVRILTEPRNALVRQYKQLFTYDGVELELTPEALSAIAQRAVAQGTGARGLRSVLEGLLRHTMYELPGEPDLCRCVVEAAGAGPGVVVRREYRQSPIVACSGSGSA